LLLPIREQIIAARLSKHPEILFKKIKGRSMKMRFLVQEHHARNLHYDFRLEMAGVLKSWALPKGPSLNPADKRLAVMVDDHSLEYFGFEGIIPMGQYGAGAVVVWDQGEYRLIEGDNPLEALEGGKMVIELGGKILKGGFTLVKMKGRGENNWLLIKRRDAHSRTKWTIQRALTKAKQAALEEKMPPCKAH
jgi:bifunctional non-homologous end joining protein LigD